MGDFTDDLLEALENKKVRRRIREIVNEDEKKSLFSKKDSDDRWKKEAERLGPLLESERTKAAGLGKLLDMEQEKNRRLNGLLESTQDQCADLERERTRLQDQIRKLEARQKELEQAAREGNYYKESYRQADYYYQLYARLGDQLHRDLSSVLSADSPESFLCRGMQWGNIEGLWDFMDSLCQKDYESETLKALGEIFDYFFEQYRQTMGTYERISTEAGEEYDEKLHWKVGGSRAGGRISQVILQGYRGISNKKIHKSVVKI